MTKDFIFKNYYRKIAFLKENSHYILKQQQKKDLLLLKTKLEKLFDTTNAKQYYQTYLKKKQTNKIGKMIKIIIH